MNSPNVQKLITVFLILAAFTSSSVFLLTESWLVPGQNGNSSARELSLGGKKVFVESMPELAGYISPLAGKSELAYVPRGGNLTDYFTDQLSEKLIAENPNGPALLNGKGSLTLPKDFEKMLDISGVIKSGFAVKLDERKIKITDKFTTEDILNYLQNSQAAIRDTLDPGLKDFAAGSLTADSLPLVLDVYDRTAEQIYKSAVPAPLRGFNSALLGFIAAQKSFFDQSDPVKALVAAQNPRLVLAPYATLLQNEAANFQKNLPQILSSIPLKDQNKFFAAINELIGINTAHALVDIIGGVANVLKWILHQISIVWDKASKLLQQMEWLRKLLTETLKDQLIHKLMQQIIGWVQGGGTPQFVNNWQEFLGDAFNVAAGSVLNQYIPGGACGNFGPLVQVALAPPPASAASQGAGINMQDSLYKCTLTDALGNAGYNIQQFGVSFDSGGFGAYGALLQPQNNFYGSLIQMHDLSTAAGSRAKEAANAEAVSGAGYKSQKECIHKDAQGRCDNYNDTTPGRAIADATKQIADSPVGRIVNANDLTALLSALVNSALNKLIGAGKKGLANLTAKDLTASGSLASTCAGLTGDDLKACQNQNQGIQGTGNSAGSSKDAILVQLKKQLDLKSQALGEAQKTLALGIKTVGYLETASSTCGAALAANLTEDSANTQSFLTQNHGEVQDRITGIAQAIKNMTGDSNIPGTIEGLKNVITLLQGDKNDQLSKLLQIPLPSQGDDQQKKEVFYNSLSSAIGDPNSAFGKLFGTIDTDGDFLGEMKTYQTTLSVPGYCGIMEKAKLIYQLQNNGVPACSLQATAKACNAGGG